MSLKTGKDWEIRQQAAKEEQEWVKGKYGGQELRVGGKRAMVSQTKDGWHATVTQHGNKLLDRKGIKTEAEAKALAQNILSPKMDAESLFNTFTAGVITKGADILRTRARPEVWASQFLPQGASKDMITQVAQRLVKEQILKPDRRRRKGYAGGETEQYRISKGWLNRQ